MTNSESGRTRRGRPYGLEFNGYALCVVIGNQGCGTVITGLLTPGGVSLEGKIKEDEPSLIGFDRRESFS